MNQPGTGNTQTKTLECDVGRVRGRFRLLVPNTKRIARVNGRPADWGGYKTRVKADIARMKYLRGLHP